MERKARLNASEIDNQMYILKSLLDKIYRLTVKTNTYKKSVTNGSQHIINDDYKDMLDELHELAGHMRHYGYVIPDIMNPIMKLSEVQREITDNERAIGELIQENEAVSRRIKLEINGFARKEFDNTHKLLLNCLRKHEKNVWTYRELLPQEKMSTV